MAENRECHRVTHVTGGSLQYRNTTFNCRLENLSMSGALVTIRSKPDFLPGNICVLKLYDELLCRNINAETLIVHQASDYVGLKFINQDIESYIALEMIMEREGHNIMDVDGNSPHSDATPESPQ